MGSRKLRALVSLLVVGALLIPVGAQAAAPRVVPGVAPSTHPGARIERTPDGTRVVRQVSGAAALAHATTAADAVAALQAQTALVMGQEPPPPDEEPAAPPSGAGGSVSEYMTAVGDLDGDQREDLVAVQSAQTVSYAGVRGRDGKQLWRYDSGMDGYGYIRSLSEDSSGSGLLAITEDFSYADDVYTITTDVTSLDRQGKVIWTHRYSGTLTETETGFEMQGVAFVMGIAPINAQPGPDVPVATLDAHALAAQAGPAYAGAASANATVSMLDGTTGAETPVTVIPSFYDLPTVSVVGDLDGDDLHDIVALVMVSDSQTVDAVAYKGATGNPLWRQALAAEFAWDVGDAGATDSDGSDDVVVSAFSFSFPSDMGDVVYLLSGADGAQRWARAGLGAVGMKDVDGDQAGDVQLVSFIDGWDAFGVKYEAVTGTGKSIYRRSYSLGFPDDAAWGSASFGPVGDVDADTRLDWGHEMRVGGATTKKQEGVVRAVSGRKAFNGPVGLPLYSPIRGKGDDLLRWVKTSSGRSVLAISGHTGKTMWSAPVATKSSWPDVAAADVNGDKIGDVVVSVGYGNGTRTWLLAGASGRALWQRTR